MARLLHFLAVGVLASWLVTDAAHADLSYTTSRQTSGGASVAGTNNRPSKYYFKGSKMKIETGDTSVILDFLSSTITAIDSRKKTISQRSFAAALAASASTDAAAKVEVTQTGQKKSIHGFNSTEIILTTNLDSPELRTMGSRVQMEMDVWLSRDVPGAAALRDYQSNAAQIPWLSLDATANQAIQTALAAMQRIIAGMDGVPLLQVIHVKPAPAPVAKPLTPAESAKMRDTIAELDAKVQRGGPEAKAATQEMSRLKALVGDDYLDGTLFGITL